MAFGVFCSLGQANDLFCPPEVLDDRLRFAMEPTFTILGDSETENGKVTAILRYLHSLQREAEVDFDRRWVRETPMMLAPRLRVSLLSHTPTIRHRTAVEGGMNLASLGSVPTFWTLWNERHPVGIGMEQDPVIELKTPSLLPFDLEEVLLPYYRAVDTRYFGFEMGGGHFHADNVYLSLRPVRFVNLLIRLHSRPRLERIFSGGEHELTLFQRGWQDEFLAAVREFRRRWKRGGGTWEDVQELFGPLYRDHFGSIRMLKYTTEIRPQLSQRHLKHATLQMNYYQRLWEWSPDDEVLVPRKWKWAEYRQRIASATWKDYKKILSCRGLNPEDYRSMVEESLENRRLVARMAKEEMSFEYLLYVDDPGSYLDWLEEGLFSDGHDFNDQSLDAGTPFQ